MQANMVSKWLVVENSLQDPKIAACGGYADEMAKEDGLWLFRHRKIDRFIAVS
jgi:hypothetical protein